MISLSGNHRIIGSDPRISVDSRIHCPRSFNAENPPPPPPTARYSEIACRAGAKIMVAMWFCRQYIEIIKVWYCLSDRSSDDLYIIGETILILPVTTEKIMVTVESRIGSQFDRDGMNFDLAATDMQYNAILDDLASDLVKKSRGTIKDIKTELEKKREEIQLIQDVFAETL